MKIAKQLAATLALSTISTLAMLQANSSIPPVLLGSIQFPTAITTLPTTSVYYCGHKLDTVEDRQTLNFSIPCSPQQNRFYLIILEHATWKNLNDPVNQIEHNTVEYLRVLEGSPYKLYLLERMPTQEQSFTENNKSSSSHHTNKVYWEVSEHVLSRADLRMPDLCVAIILPPDYIDTVESGETYNFALPPIKIRSDILEKIGSEDALHEMCTSLALRSIDVDAIHVKLEEPTKIEGRRRIIAAPSA